MLSFFSHSRIIQILIFLGVLLPIGAVSFSLGVKNYCVLNQQADPNCGTYPMEEKTDVQTFPTLPATTSEEASISSSSANTTGWQTYTGNEYTFQYPENAIVTTEKRYNIPTLKNVQSLVVKPPYQQPFEKWFEFMISEEDNTAGLDAKQIVENYAATQEEKSGPEGKSVATKVRSSLKPYTNNAINGWFAKYGWDGDFVNIVMTKNNKIYTFTVVGDAGVASEDNLKTLDQILSTFKFIP